MRLIRNLSGISVKQLYIIILPSDYIDQGLWTKALPLLAVRGCFLVVWILSIFFFFFYWFENINAVIKIYTTHIMMWSSCVYH